MSKFVSFVVKAYEPLMFIAANTTVMAVSAYLGVKVAQSIHKVEVEELHPVVQWLKDRIGGLPKPKLTKSQTALAVLGSVATVGTIAYVIVQRRRVKQSCDGYVVQLKEKLGIKVKEIPSKTVTKPVYGESFRHNSPEQATFRPKCQVLVGRVSNGDFMVFGSAIRIWDSLVTPTHVVMDASDGDDFVWVKGSQGVISINVNDFIELDTDIAMVNLTATQFSKIGCPQASINEAIPNSGEFVSICGVQGKGTVGKLVHDHTTFGKVCYSGTTMPGYSGSPYMKGTMVVGVHCWGGQVNGGYSASYIKTLIMSINRCRYEATEDWLLKVFSSGKMSKSDVYLVGGNDEARIRYNGQYHVIDGDVFRKAKGMDFLDDSYNDNESTRVINESASGESLSLNQPGDLGNVSQPGVLESLVREMLTKELSSLTTSKFRTLRKRTSSNEPTTSAGLLSQEKRN
nr:VP1 [Ulaatai Melophagus solemo-like virus]